MARELIAHGKQRRRTAIDDGGAPGVYFSIGQMITKRHDSNAMELAEFEHHPVARDDCLGACGQCRCEDVREAVARLSQRGPWLPPAAVQ